MRTGRLKKTQVKSLKQIAEGILEAIEDAAGLDRDGAPEDATELLEQAHADCERLGEQLEDTIERRLPAWDRPFPTDV